MSDFLPFIVIGLATGAVYGLAGMGLVLTYKTSGIFNFGYGAIAALDVFVFYFLNSQHGMPWPYAAAICVLVVAPLLGLLLELLARSLEGATDTIKVVSTVGIILIVDSLGTLWFGQAPPQLPFYLSQSTARIIGVNVTYQEIIVFVLSLVLAGVLFWFFRSMRLGVVMRGVVDNPELVSMAGDDPVRVRRWSWIIGTMFAAIAGLLLAPSLSIDGIDLTTVVFAAFGAAAIGYFSNLPLTLLGGLFIGVAGALVDKYSATYQWVGGLAPSLPFIVLFVVLIAIPARKFAKPRVTATRPVRRSYHAPAPVRLVAGAIAIALLALIPLIQASHLSVWSGALIDMILFLSLGLLVRRSGQISLCHLAFAAVGAAAFGHFAAAGIPWLFAVILASLVAVPIGAIIAIPAVRVSGVYLALATLGFGIIMEEVFYGRGFMFGGSTLGVLEPRPDFSIGPWHLGTDQGFYYLLLVIVVLIVAVITLITHGRLGRLLAALSDSPLGIETYGTTTSVLKVIVFCLTAAMASLAGSLTGMLNHVAVSSSFGSFASLTLVALVVIVTIGDPWYAVIAAIGYTVIPGYVTNANTSTYLQLLFGIGAAFAAFGTRGGVTPRKLQELLDRLGGRTAKQAQGAQRSVPEAGVPGGPGETSVSASRPAGVAGARGPRALRPVRWDQGRQRRGSDGAVRSHHGLGRSERRRQDHHVQRVQRPQPPELRPDPPQGRRRQPRRAGPACTPGARTQLSAHRALQHPERAPERRHGTRGVPGGAQSHRPALRLTAGHPAGRPGDRGGDGALRHHRARGRPGGSLAHRATSPRRARPSARRTVRRPAPR